jgi:hypothetical protein
VLAGGVLAGALGCEPSTRDIYRAPPPPQSVTIDDESELGAGCPSSLDPCGARLTASCRVSCQPTAGGCANVWELYRLDVLPEGYEGEWLGFDAAGNYGIFVRYPVQERSCWPWPACEGPEEAPRPTEYFIWSAAEGARQLDSGVTIRNVSGDGGVAFGTFGPDPIYWTRGAGVMPVPLSSPSMAQSGRLFAGTVENRGVRWSPEAGNTGDFPLEVLPSSVHAEGDSALFVTGRTIVYSPAAGERRDIALPLDASPDAYFRQTVLAGSGTSFAVEVEEADGAHLYRWADDVFQRIDLPAYAADYWSIERLLVSDDGRVIVAEVELGIDQRQVVRWSAESGAQVLSEDPSLYIWYVSADGNVILGGAGAEGEPKVTLRWSLDDGMQETPASQISECVGFDGDVLVDMDDHGVRALKYGSATDVSLPVEHLRGRLLAQPPFWMTLQRGSPNLGMLAGRGSIDLGDQWLWLARLQTVCASAPL